MINFRLIFKLNFTVAKNPIQKCNKFQVTVRTFSKEEENLKPTSLASGFVARISLKKFKKFAWKVNPSQSMAS